MSRYASVPIGELGVLARFAAGLSSITAPAVTLTLQTKQMIFLMSARFARFVELVKSSSIRSNTTWNPHSTRLQAV
jgi:hypothetical protein